MLLIFYKKQVIFGSATECFCSKICGRSGGNIMKFCEKLAILRKKNNMSQEQLADKLGVSRQAVSKWESGSSIPDMEKIMQLCKVLNCNLEELVDDGIGGGTKTVSDGHMTWNDYYKEILDFITKTLNMFWSMRLVEKVKCLLEMFFISLLLWFIWMMLGNFISSSFNPILSLLPGFMYSMLQTILSLVYRIFGIVVGMVLLVHIFKIRYLDYFVTIEDVEIKEKKIEVPIEEKEIKQKQEEKSRHFIERKKNKIIIRDPKHSTYGFFGILAKLAIWAIKFLLILFAIPCVFCFIGITFVDIFFLWHIKDGFFFFGLALALFGGIIINYLVLKCIYYFVLELKYPVQKIFILVMIGFVLIGTGGALSFCNYLTFKEADLVENLETTTTIKEFTKEEILQDNIALDFFENDNVKVIEDNTLDGVRVEVEHYDFLECQLYSKHYYPVVYDEVADEPVYYYAYELYFYSQEGLVEELNYIIDSLRDKKRIDFDGENNYQVTIYASVEMIDVLKDNYQKCYN